MSPITDLTGQEEMAELSSSLAVPQFNFTVVFLDMFSASVCNYLRVSKYQSVSSFVFGAGVTKKRHNSAWRWWMFILSVGTSGTDRPPVAALVNLFHRDGPVTAKLHRLIMIWALGTCSRLT